MTPKTGSQKGFTLLELVTVTAVVAVLGAVAVHLYGYYTDRARAVDIIGKFDAIRSGSTSALRTQAAVVDDCAAMASNLGNANLASAHAALTYGFQAVPDGYRPVLNVCAQAGTQGPAGVRVAREAHDTLVRNGVVEPGPVLMDSVVSFSLRLTDGERAMCKTWTAPAASPCSNQTLPSAGSGGAGPGLPSKPPVTGQGPAQVPVPVASQPVAQVPVPVASQPVAQPPQQAASRPLVPPPGQGGVPPGQAGVRPPAQAASQPGSTPTGAGGGKPVVTTPALTTPTSTPRPPTGNQGTAGTGTVSNPQRPQAATVSELTNWLEGHALLRTMNRRDQMIMADTVAMMVTDPAYARTVRAALARSPAPGPVDMPASAQGLSTIPFDSYMRRTFEMLVPMAITHLCYRQNGPNARC